MSTRCPRPSTPLPDLRPRDVIDWAEPIVRIYSSSGPFATTWNTFRRYGPLPSMRFDHQPPPPRLHPSRGVAYAAGTWVTSAGTTDPLEVCVLERFQHDGVIDRTTAKPRYVLWTPDRTLRLLQLTDSNWLTRAGGNAALLYGARGTAREWARAIYRTYPDVDGITWASGLLQTGRSVVLFERAADAIPTAPDSDRPLTEPFLQPAFARIARDYGLTLV